MKISMSKNLHWYFPKALVFTNTLLDLISQASTVSI